MSKSKLVLSVAVVIAIGGSYLFPNVKQTILGAVPTLDGVSSPYSSISGFREYRETRSLTATSSHICAFQNPFGATSTIASLSAKSTNAGIAEANNLYISTSSAAFGSSTAALVSAFAMGTGQWNVEFQQNSATTTGSTINGAMTTADTTLLPGLRADGSSAYILGPTEWVTFRIATSTAGTFSSYDAGTCSASFKQI